MNTVLVYTPNVHEAPNLVFWVDSDGDPESFASEAHPDHGAVQRAVFPDDLDTSNDFDWEAWFRMIADRYVTRPFTFDVYDVALDQTDPKAFLRALAK